MTLPPLASNFVQLIKFSSLGAVISVSEITRRGMELVATNFRPLETFTFIAVVYFLHLLAARHGDPLVGTPAAEPLMPSRLLRARACPPGRRRARAPDRRPRSGWWRVASPNPPSDTHDVAAVARALLREIPGIEVERIEPDAARRQPGRRASAARGPAAA